MPKVNALIRLISTFGSRHFKVIAIQVTGWKYWHFMSAMVSVQASMSFQATLGPTSFVAKQESTNKEFGTVRVHREATCWRHEVGDEPRVKWVQDGGQT